MLRKARRNELIVSSPACTVLKTALYTAMTEAGISEIQFARRLAKRLGVDEKAIRRLFDPHYGSKLPRTAEAIKVFGRRLDFGLEAT